MKLVQHVFDYIRDRVIRGSAKRIPIHRTAIAERGGITELRMAQIVAVTRWGMPRSVMGHCT